MYTQEGKKENTERRDSEHPCDLNLVSDQTHSAETSDRRALTSSGLSPASTVTLNG